MAHNYILPSLAGNQDITGNLTVGGTLSVTGTSTLTGNVTASGTLSVTGQTILSSDVDMARAWAIGETQTNGICMDNTTAATVGTDQFSPNICLAGNGWTTDGGGSSTSQDWRIYVHPSSTALANGYSKLMFQYSINGGAWTEAVNMDSTGILTVATSVASSGVVEAIGGDIRLQQHALNAGLGTCNWMRCANDDTPMGLINSARTDGAGNIAHAVVWDVNAATCAGKVLSVGFTDNGDTYQEQAYVRGDGVLDAKQLTASSDVGGIASTTSITNGTLAAGSNGPTFINVPGSGAAAQVGWIKIYVGTTAYAVPYWAAA